MSMRNLIIGIGVIALAIAWYAFRPELLFINKTANEGLPTAESTTIAMSKATEPMVLAKGDFRALAHETSGAAIVHQLSAGKKIAATPLELGRHEILSRFSHYPGE
jgi:hypothetical protein